MGAGERFQCTCFKLRKHLDRNIACKQEKTTSGKTYGKKVLPICKTQSGQDQSQSRNGFNFWSVLWKVKTDLSCRSENEKHGTIAVEPEALKFQLLFKQSLQLKTRTIWVLSKAPRTRYDNSQYDRKLN